MIKVEGLNKKFKKTQALDNISFNLKKGEIISVIGSSGAGKTTLLRVLSGLEKCDSGSIIIEDDYFVKDGELIKKSMENIRKNLGLVFQSLNLFPHMTIAENVMEAPLNVMKVGKEQAYEEMIKILSMLGIKDKKDSFPCELSGGQKQRVAIARALALNPKYICFDEPTSALDPKLTEEVGEIIKSLAKEGIGILVITHDMLFAKDISSSVIQMEKGEIIYEGIFSHL